MSIIKYDGVDVFSNQPTPLVSKSVNYQSQGDTRVLEEHIISLRGELTGCGIDDLASARQNAINVFSESFKNLYISGVDTFTGVKILDLSFDQAPYLQILPYSVSLAHYPSGGFEVAYGVADPQNEWTYSESDNQTVSITQSVSARGINTDFSTLGGNALDNAKNFVTSQLTGTWEIPRPYIIDTKNTNFKSYLVSFNENVDKIANTISVTREFLTDPKDLEGNVILRYSKQIEEAEGEQTRISYNGTIDAGASGYIKNYPSTREYSNLNDIRSRYTQFKDSLETTNFLTENVTEDTGINRINFSLSFNSGDTEPSIIDDFSITVQENADSSLFSVSINGNLSAKQGCIGTRFSDVSGAYDGDSHRFQICDQIYQDFYTASHGSAQSKPSSVVLNSKPLSTNVSYNSGQETVSYSNSFNDRTLLQWQADDVNSIEYDMSFTPSLQAVTSSPSATKGGFIFQDLGYTSRAGFSITTSSPNYIPSGDYIDFAKSQFSKMTEDPEEVLLEANSYNKTSANSTSSEFGRSFDSKYTILDITQDYTGLTEFRL
jgi:hypothetical protein